MLKESTPPTTQQHEWLLSLWDESLSRVQGQTLVQQALSLDPITPEESWHVVAVGKAASSMAAGAAQAWGDLITSGHVITKDDHGLAPHGWTLWEASHPVPDLRSTTAASQLLQRVDSYQQQDRLLFLLSGGASSLLVAPIDGVSLQDNIQLGRALLCSGASIHEINCVRKHLSQIKGGGLLRRLPHAKGLTLAMSDVSGDRPDAIGSGPTVPDPTTFGQAIAIMAQYSLSSSFPHIQRILEEGRAGDREETLKPFDSWGEWMPFRCLASNRHLLQTIQELAQDFLTVQQPEWSLDQSVKRVFVQAIQEIKRIRSQSIPTLLLLGGEPTLEITTKDGMGGRMQHLALMLAEAIAGFSDIWILAGGSDGTDGPTDAAGAIVDGVTVQRGVEHGWNVRNTLHNFDSYSFHQVVQTSLVTGPTGTHLGDVVMILCWPSSDFDLML